MTSAPRAIAPRTRSLRTHQSRTTMLRTHQSRTHQSRTHQSRTTMLRTTAPVAAVALPTAVVLVATAALLAGCGRGGSSTGQASPWRAPDGSLPATASPAGSPPAASPSAARPSRPPVHHTFPVVAKRADYGHTHGLYPATDIFAACGSPVRAVTAGVILEVSRVDRFDPDHPKGAYKGGLFVSLLGDDGVRYYGAHLSTVQPGIAPGVRVAEGAGLGTLGRTGNASNICHLHFGISPPCRRTGDWWVRRGAVYPWPYFDAWRAGREKSPAAATAEWQRTHGCPATPPAGSV